MYPSEPLNLLGAKITILSPNENGLKSLNEDWEKWEKEHPDLSSGRSGSTVNDYSCTVEELLKRFVKEDKRVTNESSIAFLLEYNQKKVLFLADSHPSVIVESLKGLSYSKDNKLIVDYVKLSHHGSRENMSFELLEIIDCQKYIISTNGTKNFPNKETLVRIICNEERDDSQRVYFIFNYGENIFGNMFTDEDKEKYNFECFFSNVSNGYEVEL